VRATILGSGTSSGVPRIGRDWGACDPAEPRNRRTRASIMVEHGGTRILVDTSPDMREQLLAANIDKVDAIIWTHDHADHCHGIDDVRQLFHAVGSPIRGLARPSTLRVIEDRFSYAFRGRSGYPSTIAGEVLPDRLIVGGITIDVVDQPHGRITSSGLRFSTGDGRAIGYATDFNELTDDMAALYRALDLWIVDALRRAPHPSHPTVAQVLDWVQRLAPRRSALVHMDHSMDYASLIATLPPGVEPGYDGMVLEV
jgi:phosphoribosyl 1,2-cyclic phosphate phosphodiesterase